MLKYMSFYQKCVAFCVGSLMLTALACSPTLNLAPLTTTTSQFSSQLKYWRPSGASTTHSFNVSTLPVAADINNDGYLDIIGDSFPTTIRLAQNNSPSSRSFTLSTATAVSSIIHFTTGYIDADSNLDILHTTYANGTKFVDVLLGNGNFTFNNGTDHNIANTRYGSHPRLADLNEDGFVDLVAPDPLLANSNLVFIPGNGDGTFGATTTLAVSGSTFNEVLIADYDNDGYKDILSTGTGTIDLIKSNHNGTFAAATTITTGATNSRIFTTDFNKDGYMDIIANTSTNLIRLSFGTGSGNFGSFSTLFSDCGTGKSFALADVNSDGYTDIIYITSGNIIKYSLNSNGSFAAASTFSTSTSSSYLIVEDFDKDGAYDVFINSTTTSYVYYGSLSY